MVLPNSWRNRHADLVPLLPELKLFELQNDGPAEEVITRVRLFSWIFSYSTGSSFSVCFVSFHFSPWLLTLGCPTAWFWDIFSVCTHYLFIEMNEWEFSQHLLLIPNQSYFLRCVFVVYTYTLWHNEFVSLLCEDTGTLLAVACHNYCVWC